MIRYYYYLTIAFLLSAYLQSNAQQQAIKTQFSQNYTGYSLVNFMAEVEHDYPIRFFFKPEWVDNIKIPSVPDNSSLSDILNRSLSGHDLSFICLKQNNVIIIPESYTYFENNSEYNFLKVVGNPLEKGKNTLNKVEGTVFYGKTGEPLPGVLVFEKKFNKQTSTDHNGKYSLMIPGGITQLKFSFMGLQTNIIDVEVMSNGKLDAELMEEPIALSDITIRADGGKNNIERTQMGMTKMDIRNISKLPVLMGEADIIKSMTLLPGVSTMGEMSAGFNVRGGNVDQNLVLVDNTPVYSSSHLFGLFSTLIPEAVGSVTMYKGTQPSNYGSKVSSVMEIDLKQADTLKIKGKASLGVLNSSLFVQGPIPKTKHTFFVGARTTYSDWLLKTIPDYNIQNSKANFYDGIARINFRLSAKSNLTLFGYASHDNFTYSDLNDFSYGSIVSSITYNKYFNSDVSMRATVGYTSYNSELGQFDNKTTAYKFSSGIDQITAKIQTNIYVPKNDINVGIEAINYIIRPGEKSAYYTDNSFPTTTLPTEKALEGGFFIQDNFKINQRISLQAGVRLSMYSRIGDATLYSYDANSPKNENTISDTSFFGKNELVKPYYGIEPRLGLKISLTENSSIKIGYYITNQYQHLISNTTVPVPADYWKTSDLNVKPLYCQQYSLGYFKNFLGDVIETSAELYYKTTENVPEYKDGATLAMNPNIEQDIIQGFSTSYGAEFMIRKNMGKLTGWLSYTLSKSFIQTRSQFAEETINNGDYYYTNNDRLHDMSLTLSYQLTRRWNFASNFLLSSGRPATYPEKKYIYRNIEVVEFSDRNEYRLPAYHRLDVSLTYEGFLKKTKKIHPSFTFSVYNLYGRNNVYSVYYKKDRPTSNNDYQIFGLYQLSVIGVPIPSFTINLSF